MKSTVEKIDQNKVVLEVEVPVDKFEVALNKAYKKVVAKVSIPGFRKGKAPRKILEQFYGPEVLFEDALEIIVPEAYFNAVEEHNVEPVDQPNFDMVQLELGKPLIFKATVAVKPEVVLGEYKGLEYKAEPVEITEEAVQQQLENLQKRHARMAELSADSEAQMGDTVMIDFEGFKDDVPFEGGKGADYQLELGSNTFIPGFEEALVGVKVGEERTLDLTFPEEYHVAELAGQPVKFVTVIKEIKRKEYAPIDDEFAKDVSDFDTLAELTEDIRKNLQTQAEQAKDREIRNSLIDKAVEQVEISIPEAMINERAEQMMQDYGRRLEYQGISLDNFLEMTKQSKESLMANFLPEAENSVKRDLVLQAIAKAENLDVTDEEIDKEIAELAENYRQPADVLRKLLVDNGQLSSLKDGMKADKAIQFLIDNASVQEG
ncbi:trigger factor [Heliorestis acidaminivorans]|uniref:Trigger factor n=1 Tax=Heliorestis acidaminivorans TaxID=553427 RepID=A0A6I0EQT7_9FIRM|nr:trigger factor [Heliorestis acidaminivorans]KAB2952586.1 trigger factor [Heliorestis acidaminivorans]